MGGSEVSKFPPRRSQLQLPSTRVITRVSAVCHSGRARHLLPILIALQGPGRGDMHGGSLRLQRQQLSYNPSNLRPAKRDFGILNRREHKGQGLGDQQPLKITPEHSWNCGWGGGGAYPTQSGGYRGKFQCPRLHHSL